MAIDLDVHGNTKPLEAAVQAAVNRIRRKPIQITVDDKGATQPLGNMKRAADEFSKSMEAANARILAFGASMAIINGVADAFKGMVRNLVEVEKSLADINVVMGLSAQNLDKFSDGLFKVAKETGAAFRVAADAATEYARQGLSVEESLKRTRDALVLTRLTGMDSAEAVKSLTAAMNTYGKQIKDTTQLVSKFAAVDVQFAVSAEDFAAAISRTGQAAKSAGVDIDELIGIVTSAQQQTARGGAVIGNALKTIFTKTGRTDTLNQLENLGIAVRDLEGNTIGARRILTDLANTFDHLSEAQKAQITQTMGGLFHINILKAVLSDAAKQNGILAKATQISASATDEAIQKNEQLRQTMSAMATETGLAIKELSVQIGELMLAPGMEKILNAVKGIAESATDILDGEGAGSKFANGFLKGLGNIITGPGLVVLSAVFIKLFGTAVKFTKESLTSLIGVTSEAQKQKAIQTTLVGLLGRNAALSQEMLRTDISRTEKEKILLGLLQAQTAEANKLNAISKQLAGTLYTKGYGPGLTQGRRRAQGHIPNFADPERAQAARGGYAAGNIRSMNMPGEGPIIYNSAETVKNFAGFKQPAIMPPQSSKAGKNYQQAFGNIHGFDPYAAGGYIPNFNESWISPRQLNPGSSQYVGLSASASGDKSGHMFVTAGKGKANVFTMMGSPYQKAARKSTPAQVFYDFYSLDDSDKRKYFNSRVEDDLNQDLQRASHGIVNGLLKTLSSPDQNFIAKKSDVTKDLPEHKMSVVAGHIFEAATKTILRSLGAESSIPGSETARIDLLPNKELYQLFNVKGKKGSKGAEAKINSSIENAKSFARKIYDLEVRDKGVKPTVSKTSDLLTRKRGTILFQGKEIDKNDASQQAAIKAAFPDLKNKTITGRILDRKFNIRGYGHIPNFADPLSDAIGREKAAGVPVSQIRVGSHSALMSKGNPLGLGVTNTYDEPNGLRDVFGANGFVPNYATPSVSAGDIIPDPKFQRLQKTQQQLADQYNKVLKRLIDRYEKGIGTHGQLNNNIQRLNSKYNVAAETQDRVTSEVNKNIGVIGKLNQARRRYTSSITNANKSFAGHAAGKAFASSGGQMALMMGLPMAGGFLQDAVGGSIGAGIGGAMTGAATGASMGMMFGPLGTAIGAAAGGLYGLVNGLNEAEQAAREKAEAEKDSMIQARSINMQQGLSQAIGQISKQEISDIFTAKNISEFKSATEARHYAGTNIIGTSQYKGMQLLERLQASDFFSQFGKHSGGKISMLDILKPGAISGYTKDKEEAQIAEAYAQQMALMQGIQSLPSDARIQSGEDKISKKQFLEKITTYDFADPEELKRFQEDVKNARKIFQETADTETERQKALILQLNIQRAMLNAQQEAKSIQLDINNSFAEVSSSLDLQSKIMGNFATEQQKAQMNYTKAINRASEKYALSAQREEERFRSGLLGFVKDPNIESKLKTALAKQQLQKEKEGFPKEFASPTKEEIANRAKILNLTEQLSALTNEELEVKLRSLGLSPTEIQQIEYLKTAKQGNLELALKELTASRDRLGTEFKINDAIARRKDIVANMKFGSEMMGQVVGHEQAMRGLRYQVGAAERLTALGPGYQTAAAQEDFQMKEKRIQLENQIKTIRENAQVQLSQEREKLAEILLQNQQLKDLQDKKGELSKEDLNTMNSLIDSQGERDKALIKIENAQSNINEKAKEEISTAEKLLQLEEQRLRAKRAHETGPGAFGNGMTDAFTRMREQVTTMDYELGQKIPFAFADGLANAMTEAFNGTKNIKDGLMDAAVSFLGMIQQAMMQKAVYSIVGGMPFSRGGNVRNYSKGGGVPARVSNGEYVMGRDAVAKYGGSFMHSLNAGGKIPGYSNGGAPGSALASGFGGGRGHESGRAYQSRAMSSFFYSQSGNVGLAEDTSAMMGILQEEERKRQEAEARRQAKKAKRRQLIGSLVGIAAAAGLNFGAEKGLFGKGIQQNALRPTAGFQGPMMPKYLGGPIRKYASGGYISGKSGIDQIPAMLSEGEYVIRASSARQLGKPMLDRINAGKFNEGGAVSELMGGSETRTSGGNTNNINISINMERGSGSKKETSGQDKTGQNPADRSSDEQNNAALAERIKQQVVAVIVEEQRPGGLLDEKS